jgi:hypothetical protein
MTSQVPFEQRKLSEQLQLLNEFGYSDLHVPYHAAGIPSNKDVRSSDTNTGIRLLDTICVSLTSGNPGDVVTAALDRRERLCLVLSKNRAPTLEDERATKSFVSAITNPAATNGIHIFPFLIS